MKFLILLVLSGTKSPAKAAIYSFLVPGAGQFYVGDYFKGAVFAGTQGYLLYELYRTYNNRQKWKRDTTNYYEYRISYFSVLYVGVWAFSIADAYVSAHLYEFEKDTTLTEPMKEKKVFLVPDLKNKSIKFGFLFKFF